MAQTGYTPILIYSSSTGGNTPAAGSLTNSTLGSELAINITDGKLFYKDNANAIQVIGWKTTPTTAGGTGLTSYTAGDLLYFASGTTLSKLAIGASTTILTSNGTAPQWSAASGITIGAATNLSGGAQGSLPYQSAASTTAFLAKNTTASRYLSNSGTSNNPAWAQIDLSNGVTGTLPVANGGSGAATFTAGYLKASGTSAFTTTSTIPQSDITGMGAYIMYRTFILYGVAGQTATLCGGGGAAGTGPQTLNMPSNIIVANGTAPDFPSLTGYTRYMRYTIKFGNVNYYDNSSSTKNYTFTHNKNSAYTTTISVAGTGNGGYSQWVSTDLLAISGSLPYAIYAGAWYIDLTCEHSQYGGDQIDEVRMEYIYVRS
jgi:hypothetical protein